MGGQGDFIPQTPDWVKPLIQSAAAIFGVPTRLLSALLYHESRFNPKAKSRAGAMGIAQFMPGTARGMGVDPWDPKSAIMGAARYLRNLYNQFKRWDLALAAYNAGPGRVQRYGGIPPIRETQNYVKNIMAMFGGSPVAGAIRKAGERQPVVPSSPMSTSLPGPTATAAPSPTPKPSNIEEAGRKESPVWRLFDAIRRIFSREVVSPLPSSSSSREDTGSSSLAGVIYRPPPYPYARRPALRYRPRYTYEDIRPPEDIYRATGEWQYTVQPGENEQDIEREFGLPMPQIYRVNQPEFLKYGNRLRPGMRIRLPPYVA